MVRSIWRWSHLVLALSASVFLVLASVSGIFLSFDPLKHAGKSLSIQDDIPVSAVIDSLNNHYLEIFSIECDKYGFYKVSALNEQGDIEDFQLNPSTGRSMGAVVRSSDLTEWMTTFHRSLFLDKLGRFFVGITATCLVFIAISGIILVVRRGKSIKSLFERIEKSEKTLLYRFYHIVLGRLAFIPILILALTGSYLFLQRFGVLSTNQEQFVDIHTNSSEKISFSALLLSELTKIEFPFSPDEEDYYVLSTENEQLTVDQYTFKILSKKELTKSSILSAWSLDLHTATGRINGFWALILGLACLSILYFIYSGIRIFIFSFQGKIRNKYALSESDILLLVGSQNSNTMIFAKLVYQALIEAGHRVFLSDLNAYKPSNSVKNVLIFTSTYGVGEPPINATRFLSKWQEKPLKQSFSYSIVGFGSLAYPDFCQFAMDIQQEFKKNNGAKEVIPMVKIHNQSYHSLKIWAIDWQAKTELNFSLPASIETKKPVLHSFIVQEKRESSVGQDNETFTLKLGSLSKYTLYSGDLLAVYPPGDPYERFYSIGKIADNQLFISIRKHSLGICSTYLSNLSVGDRIEAGIKTNSSFRYNPRQTAILIGNGTGMGSFLGMIAENKYKKQLHLYWGGRNNQSFELYKHELDTLNNEGKISSLHVAFSRPREHKKYVGDVVRENGQEIALLLTQKAIIYICGSLAMQQDVLKELENICLKNTKKSLHYFQKKGQIKMDCY